MAFRAVLPLLLEDQAVGLLIGDGVLFLGVLRRRDGAPDGQGGQGKAQDDGQAERSRFHDLLLHIGDLSVRAFGEGPISVRLIFRKMPFSVHALLDELDGVEVVGRFEVGDLDEDGLEVARRAPGGAFGPGP